MCQIAFVPETGFGAELEDFTYGFLKVGINPASVGRFKDFAFQYNYNLQDGGNRLTGFMDQTTLHDETGELNSADGSTAVSSIKFKKGELMEHKASIVMPLWVFALGFTYGNKEEKYKDAVFLKENKSSTGSTDTDASIKTKNSDVTLGMSWGGFALGLRSTRYYTFHKIQGLDVSTCSSESDSDKQVCLVNDESDDMNIWGKGNRSATDYGIIIPIITKDPYVILAIYHRPETKMRMRVHGFMPMMMSRMKHRCPVL
ncbi:MAG: hypothetical protein HQM14_12545 [SAR324 cluster bacterium]|nr:hypothetical protein [SAR324 cluster bacterium]